MDATFIVQFLYRNQEMIENLPKTVFAQNGS